MAERVFQTCKSDEMIIKARYRGNVGKFSLIPHTGLCRQVLFNLTTNQFNC